MRLFLLLFTLILFPVAVNAAETAADPGAVVIPKQDPADLDKRLELARKLHELLPVSIRDQVNTAIEDVAKAQAPEQQEIFRANMRAALNYQALEKISVDAMAEIFTADELQARLDYYSKPEAKTAAKKDDLYAQKVYPEIIRMLDQAMMRARIGQ